MLEQLSANVVQFLRDTQLSRRVLKAWVFRDYCVVVDFKHKFARFAAHVIPVGKDLVSLEILARPGTVDLQLIGGSSGKEMVIEGTSIGQALEVMRAKVLEVISAIDRLSPAPSPVLHIPPVASTGNAPQPGPRSPGDALRVGVLTLPLHTNIGGNLQAYALVESIRRLGHDAILINRRHPLKEGAAPTGVAEGQDVPRAIGQLLGVAHPPIRSFMEMHLGAFSPMLTSTDELSAYTKAHGFDAIVAGSDQVWRPKYSKGILSDYFFGFVPEDDARTRRISYAASFGAQRWEFTPEQTAVASALAKRFDAMSVREDSAVALCERYLGVKPKHVLDPTMLLTPRHYLELVPSPQRESGEGRLVTYVLDVNPDKAAVVNALSRRLSLAPCRTDGGAFGHTSAPVHGSVEGWIAALHNAAFVVTDSFHGTAFSILFNKPFVAYSNASRGSARFLSLLKMFGLEGRLVGSSNELDVERMLQPIDWAAVNARIDTLRQDSLAFLTSALTPPGPAQAKPSADALAVSATTSAVASAPAVPSPELKAVIDELAALPNMTQAFLKTSVLLSLRDSQRFVKAAGGKPGFHQSRAQLMFRAHAIEKGLSHMQFRPRFGEKAIERLAQGMRSWLAAGRPPTDQFFLAAASVMRAYFERHAKLGVDVSDYRGMFDSASLEKIAEADDVQGGVVPASAEREPRVAVEQDKNFIDVIYGRRSIREWTSAPVRDEDIAKAVQIAMQAPSVCNRQAGRVHRFSDPVAIREALALQGGFNGYKMPPKLLLVTSDMAVFLAPTERRQAFIDGGLFMMSLLLGLEQVGLGSCCLNTAMTIEREDKIRDILSIPPSEAFISFIAVGHYDRDVLVPVSKRVSVHEVFIPHDRAQ